MKKILKLTLTVMLVLCAEAVVAQKFGRVDLAAIVPVMPEYRQTSWLMARICRISLSRLW